MNMIVADIGGTNARFGCCVDGMREIEHVRILRGRDYDSFLTALAAYIEMVDLSSVGGLSSIDGLALAVAGPVRDGVVAVTNSHWRIDRSEIIAATSIGRVIVINDFVAQALAQTEPDVDRKLLRAGRGDPSAPLVVIGPGSGLGVSALIPSTPHDVLIEGEGGHMAFSPQTELEYDMLRDLRQQYGHVSMERIISGQGLAYVYGFLSKSIGRKPEYDGARQIGEAAIAGDSLACEAVEVVLAALGSAIADIVLLLGAWQGVVIAGGVVHKQHSLLDTSGIWERMNDKGRMSKYIEDVPVWLANNPLVGLHGARVALLRHDFAANR